MNSEGNQHNSIHIILSGLVMGMAEVIPGVSGGTVAFVTGIYERLISAISSLRKVPALIAKRRWNDLIQELDLWFLVKLGVGMATGIVIGALVITRFLESHPPVIWALFFGLIIGSIFYMLSKLDIKLTSSWTMCILGILVALGIGMMEMGGGNTSLVFVFVSGMIAIMALVLPGISGSFLLLMMGMYTYIVGDTLKGLLVDFTMDRLVVMMVFAVGCLVGLLTITRGLQWAFDKYKNATFALLTGFMIGALPKIWPWKNPVKWLNKENGEILTSASVLEDLKVVKEVMVLPDSYLGSPLLLGSILAFLTGLSLLLLFWRLERK